MAPFSLKNKDSYYSSLEAMVRKVDLQLIQITSALEKVNNLAKEAQKIDERLTKLEKIVSSEGFSLQPHLKVSKTKDAIRLILKRYGELTPEQLSRLIKLSRTRSNEYLKEMEREGLVVSRVECRKKYYRIRQ